MVITEMDVIEAVCSYLKDDGYTIKQALEPTRKGIDIIAVEEGTGERFYVEAKGASSSRSQSNRYGKPSKLSQVKTHDARAFYMAASFHRLGTESLRIGIALPNTDLHRDLIEEIRHAVEVLNIEVFFVGRALEVTKL